VSATLTAPAAATSRRPLNQAARPTGRASTGSSRPSASSRVVVAICMQQNKLTANAKKMKLNPSQPEDVTTDSVPNFSS
jgi:hypothetical protein